MSSPFQKQFSAKTPIAAPSPSPLNGAYTSGADGMVTVSDASHFQKLQNDIVSAVDKSVVRPKVSKCDQGAEYYFDKDGAKFMCPEQKNTDNSNRESSEGTGGFAGLIYGSAEKARDVKATNDLNTAVKTAVKGFV